MRLIEDLRAALEQEDSYFRQHLIREDLARLANVVAAFPAAIDRAAFIKATTMIGWTTDDLRTFELKPTLEPLLGAIHDSLAAVAAGRDKHDADDRVAELWAVFQQDRLDRLVGCLARVPRPD